LEVRRSDYAAWVLTIDGWLHPGDLVAPIEVRYSDLARVHSQRLLTSLTDGEGLANVFHADPAEIRVPDVMRSIRRACGATLDGARRTLRSRRPTFTLLGGFHHAFPDKAGGLCPVNDIAVAIAAVRAEGFSGRVAVLDLDAHPPDGTAACVEGDPEVWIGSISGSDWGSLPGVDEVVLPPGSGDTVYLAALGELLARMPRVDLAFVLAGGDVLVGDRMGQLALTLDGVRRRDLAVVRALSGVPSVWMPAGGYSSGAWRVVVGTALALGGYGRAELDPRLDPHDLRFNQIARRLDPQKLGQPPDDDLDLAVALGVARPGPPRLLGHYTEEGVRYALDAYGLLEQLGRLGYSQMRIEIQTVPLGDRLRVYGRDDAGNEHVLGETVLERKELRGRPVLFVHWLTLRHPAALGGRRGSRLPGQEVPGLGLVSEALEMLTAAARRIGAEGVAFRPSYYHTVWPTSSGARFLDDGRQGRFEALVRDLGAMGRAELSAALQQGRVRLQGEPYVWEPDEMVWWLENSSDRKPAVDQERDRSRFTVVPPNHAQP
jgi:acetoin utilization deacetylase AcuC-like enzyme